MCETNITLGLIFFNANNQSNNAQMTHVLNESGTKLSIVNLCEFKIDVSTLIIIVPCEIFHENLCRK